MGQECSDLLFQQQTLALMQGGWLTDIQHGMVIDPPHNVSVATEYRFSPYTWYECRKRGQIIEGTFTHSNSEAWSHSITGELKTAIGFEAGKDSKVAGSFERVAGNSTTGLWTKTSQYTFTSPYQVNVGCCKRGFWRLREKWTLVNTRYSGRATLGFVINCNPLSITCNALVLASPNPQRLKCHETSSTVAGEKLVEVKTVVESAETCPAGECRD